MKSLNKVVATVAAFAIFTLMSCNSVPQPIRLGTDACSFCKMSIADQRFGAEIVTKKGKVFKFDDMHCILAFRKAGIINNDDIKETWLINFNEPHNFIVASKAFLLESNKLHSPMGGNIAAFEDKDQLEDQNQKIQGKIVFWKELIKGK